MAVVDTAFGLYFLLKNTQATSARSAPPATAASALDRGWRCTKRWTLHPLKGRVYLVVAFSNFHSLLRAHKNALLGAEFGISLVYFDFFIFFRRHIVARVCGKV